jgi:DDE superfamily endonuclease
VAAGSHLVPDRGGAPQAEGRGGPGAGSGSAGKKKLIERAYTVGATLGLATWCEDEAGPFQTVPYAGVSWQLETKGRPLEHEYIRNGTAKLMTLFCPATGEVRVRGTRSCTNKVLHHWMQEELLTTLAALPVGEDTLSPEENRQQWEQWQEGLTTRITLPSELPRLRLLLVMDNLTGHRTPSLVLWLFAHGVMPLYTPLGGSWLNMGESIQRILKRRGIDGQHPQTPDEIVAWLEAAARGWNAAPTPFEWGGKRALRRQRSRERRHGVGGSYAFTRRPIRRSKTVVEQWQQACQTTH